MARRAADISIFSVTVGTVSPPISIPTERKCTASPIYNVDISGTVSLGHLAATRNGAPN